MKLSTESNRIEALPISHVIYPRGAFPVFKKEDEYFLCACMKEAVGNYLKLRRIVHPEETGLDVWNFPESYVEHLKGKLKDKTTESIIGWFDHMVFEKDLCHRCNLAKPSIDFCPPSEGTVFRRQYGWYLDMKHFEYGVVPRLQRYLPDMESDGLRALIAYRYTELLDDMIYDVRIEEMDKELVHEWLRDHDTTWEPGSPRVWDPQYPYNFTQVLGSHLEKRRVQVRRYIEDAIRSDFKYPSIAGRWKSEEKLYEIVRKLIPGLKIKRHFRPAFLEHLELDIYIPELNIGIEYQGIQHYEPVKYFGGKRGLEKVRARDERKRNLAMENNVQMIYFHHYEVLTRELVHRKLKPWAQAYLRPVTDFSAL